MVGAYLIRIRFAKLLTHKRKKKKTIATLSRGRNFLKTRIIRIVQRRALYRNRPAPLPTCSRVNLIRGFPSPAMFIFSPPTKNQVLSPSSRLKQNAAGHTILAEEMTENDFGNNFLIPSVKKIETTTNKNTKGTKIIVPVFTSPPHFQRIRFCPTSITFLNLLVKHFGNERATGKASGPYFKNYPTMIYFFNAIFNTSSMSLTNLNLRSRLISRGISSAMSFLLSSGKTTIFSPAR